MANLCLPKQNRERLKNALKQGDITLARLYDMTSEQRNTIFKQYVGDDFASFVNAKFEQAMLSNQKKAIANWIQQTTSHKDPIRRDMLKKVGKIEKVLTADEERGFLKDLAESKLGISVSEEEAQTIISLKSKIDELREKIPDDSPVRSKERIAYGLVLDQFKEFVGKMKLEADKLTWKERLAPSNTIQNIIDAAGASKSFVATLDNSFIGRQGIKTLLRGNYKIWATTLVESFKAFGKELVAKSPGLFKDRESAVMSAIRADIFSRPNALNGKYKAAKNGYELGILTEEAFPSSFPERIPLLGRLFKASETAFNGSALRMRADLADAMIAAAEKNGVDMLDEAQATSFGKLVASMTGRGGLGKGEAIARETNALLFSIKFLKSNFDTITAHQLDSTMTPEAKRAAIASTLRIAASLTAILSVAKMLNPESVDFDPRGANFGKIKIGNHKYDITGGMSGLITLGSRLFPAFHNGEFGFWTKNASTGKYTKMTGENYGEQTALDVFEQFWEGKLSPLAGVARDVLRQQNFQGEKPGFINTTIGLVTPISANLLIEELKKGNDDVLLAMMGETLGISPTDTTQRGSSKKWKELKEKEGEEVYNRSLKQVTERFNDRSNKLESSSRWKKLNNEEQAEELQKIKDQETNRIFKRYGI